MPSHPQSKGRCLNRGNTLISFRAGSRQAGLAKPPRPEIDSRSQGLYALRSLRAVKDRFRFTHDRLYDAGCGFAGTNQRYVLSGPQ